MANKAQDIEFLPAGWRWVAAGKETWITSTGQTSTARHARKGNETLSTRQVQNVQRSVRKERGIPKAPTIHRTGRIRTIKSSGPRSKKLQSSNTKEGGIGSLYVGHGRTETYVFYTFDDAQQWALTHDIPGFSEDDGLTIVQIRFTDRLKTSDRPGSDTTGGPGYAAITTLDRSDLFFGNAVNDTHYGSIIAPWEMARERIQNYDMSGKDARVYIYVTEE